MEGRWPLTACGGKLRQAPPALAAMLIGLIVIKEQYLKVCSLRAPGELHTQGHHFLMSCQLFISSDLRSILLRHW